MFGKAIKWKNINGVKVGYFKIPKKRKPTKRSLEFDLIQINAYEQLAEKYPEKDYKQHLAFLYAFHIENKKLINRKYQLTEKEKNYSFEHLRHEFKRLNDLTNNPDLTLPIEEQKRRIDTVYGFIKEHFQIVWNITDEYIISKLNN